MSVRRHFMSQIEEKRSSPNLQAGKPPGPLSDAYFSDNYLLSASVTSLQSRLNLNAAQFRVFPAAARITTLTADPLLVRHSHAHSSGVYCLLFSLCCFNRKRPHLPPLPPPPSTTTTSSSSSLLRSALLPSTPTRG